MTNPRLNNKNKTVEIKKGKKVKVDYLSGNTTVQVKGRINEINDSLILLNNIRIHKDSITTIYANHIKRIILGSSLLVIDVPPLYVFSTATYIIIAGAGGAGPILVPFIIATSVGIPLTITGIRLLSHKHSWKTLNKSDGWIISIKNVK